MPRSPVDRFAWRDTFLYAFTDPTIVLGGLWTAPGTTHNNLYSMVNICWLFSAPFDLQDEHQQLLARDEEPLLSGNYYIVSAGSITETDEAVLRRTGLGTGYRAISFPDAVRERDKRCVITGRKARLANFRNWNTFHACHIFPLAYEQQWNDSNFGRWITVPPPNESDGTINSVQNGILLSNDIHGLFDFYSLTINPDDNYKIVCFSPDTLDFNIAGRHLDQMFHDHPHRPVIQILRWHFRQAVLVNMRGARKSSFETDFPPGSDMMSEDVGRESSRDNGV